MSTRTESTHDDATAASPRTDHATDFSSTDPPASGESRADRSTPRDGRSWTDRCERQFATTHTTRLRNLADEENQAMHDGV